MTSNPLVELDEENRFTRRQIRQFANWSQYKTHIAINELLRADILEKSGKAQHGQYKYKLNPTSDELNNPEKMVGLISIEDLKQKIAESKSF